MKMIVAEKAIAAKRIASILGEKVREKIDESVPTYYLTKGGQDYLVVPLKGHIEDVDFPKRFWAWIGTDLRKLALAPVEYAGKEKRIIRVLRKEAKNVEEVIIATDSDREGEAIGVEALRHLKESNPKLKTSRMYYSAITKQDIEKAFSSLTKVDTNLADSANARREIDLIWGAVLTRFLSIVSGRLGKKFLSSGRVQSPTLALIVDREKERLAFDKKKYWIVKALFSKQGKEFEAEHAKGRFELKEEALKVLEKETAKGIIKEVSKKKAVLKKPIPFNTTEFLRAASAIGCTPSEAMDLAENLYMNGYISYPRTDNSCYPETLNLKEIVVKLAEVKEFNEMAEKILSKKKLDPSKGKESKDHPPIHPVSAASKDKLSSRHWKVYELVCRRFFATLADDCQTMNTKVVIGLNNEPFVAKGLIIEDPGWKEFYPYSKTKEVTLPELREGEEVDLKKLEAEEKETKPPARFSQGVLIKKMSDLNLGTKATRHEIIKKLLLRHYVKGRKELEPTQVSFAVVEALEKYAKDIVQPEMTATLEQEMDLIAEGKKGKEEVVGESRSLLSKVLEKMFENKNDIGASIREALAQQEYLGECPKCGKGNLKIMFGRTGKRFAGCTNYPACKNSFPLPPKGMITPAGNKCLECSHPIIITKLGRRSIEQCVNHLCPTRKQAEKALPEGKEEKTEAKEVTLEAGTALAKKKPAPKTAKPKPKKGEEKA